MSGAMSRMEVDLVRASRCVDLAKRLADQLAEAEDAVERLALIDTIGKLAGTAERLTARAAGPRRPRKISHGVPSPNGGLRVCLPSGSPEAP